MKRADAAAIRKSLGCMRRCSATGPRTHHPECPAVGKWLDDAPPMTRSREASVPVGELEVLVTEWRRTSNNYAAISSGSSAGFGMDAGLRRCADDVQALIDRVTP